MSEKPESEEFEDEDDDPVQGDEESLDVDRLMQDLDKRKRGAPRGSEPAWRKLERLLEQKRTSELLSDFDDYDIGDGTRPGRPAQVRTSQRKSREGATRSPSQRDRSRDPVHDDVHHFAFELQLARHPHQTRTDQRAPLPLRDLPPHDEIDVPRLVLERDEGDPAGGTRALARDHQPGRTHPRAAGTLAQPRGTQHRARLEPRAQQLERMTPQAQTHVPVIRHDVLTLARRAQQRYALGDLRLGDQG